MAPLDHLVGQPQLDLGFRIGRHEFEDRLLQEMAAEADGSRYADRAGGLGLRFGEPDVGGLDLPERRARLRIVEPPGLRHAEAAGRALQEAHAEVAFKGRNPAADRRLGHGKQSGSRGEAAGFDDAGEDHDIVEIDHCCSEWDDVWHF